MDLKSLQPMIMTAATSSVIQPVDDAGASCHCSSSCGAGAGGSCSCGSECGGGA